MSFSRPIHWYRSHADSIWPDGIFKKFVVSVGGDVLRAALRHAAGPPVPGQ
jgi:hypothetical protein